MLEIFKPENTTCPSEQPANYLLMNAVTKAQLAGLSGNANIAKALSAGE